MKRVLFVDDEPNVLAGLRRMLRPMRQDWEMDFATGGSEALELINRRPYDAIVSDMRMPGMDGAALLDEVAVRTPEAVRILLSGQSAQEKTLRAVGPAHQFLAKPCEPQQIREAVEAASRINAAIHNPTLRAVVARIDSLPSRPETYAALVGELEANEPDMGRVARIIAGDLAMTTKVLQLVNSSFFGRAARVTDPKEAASILGLDRLRPLALAACVFAHLTRGAEAAVNLESLTDHCLAVGLAAQRLARVEAFDKRLTDETMLAGMLHDVGKLILLARLPQDYRRTRQLARERSLPAWQAELEILGASHAELGAYLLALWGLPQSVVAAVAWHHRPGEAPVRELSPLTLVHAADALLGFSDCGPGKLDRGYLASLHLESREDAWRREIDALAAEEALG